VLQAEERNEVERKNEIDEDVDRKEKAKPGYEGQQKGNDRGAEETENYMALPTHGPRHVSLSTLAAGW
jgi:hypothetical protein